jgi:peptide/nickel transport system substrate-binding protein
LSNDTVGYVNLSSDLTYNQSKAESLLTAAEWVPGPNGIRQKDGKQLSLTLGWINNFGPNQNALQLLQAELQQVGVKVTLETGVSWVSSSAARRARCSGSAHCRSCLAK